MQAESVAERGMRELWIANRELDRRVAERTAQLRASLESSQAATRLKQDLLAGLGHELATPLHAILGLLELVDREATSPDNPARLRQVHASAEALSWVLSGLMAIAAADVPADPDDQEQRVPSSIIDDLSSRWIRRLARNGQLLVCILVGPDDALTLDWQRLLRISDALLDNVERHAVQGSVRVELTVGAHDVSVAVTDEGPGFSDTDLGTVHEPFAKSNNSDRYGIGLAVASRLAQNAGGSLHVVRDAASGGSIATATVARPVSDDDGPPS